jgi:hypothetical protein
MKPKESNKHRGREKENKNNKKKNIEIKTKHLRFKIFDASNLYTKAQALTTKESFGLHDDAQRFEFQSLLFVQLALHTAWKTKDGLAKVLRILDL